ncbi:RICIN domain-containing protein [Streptomyces sp. NPDC001276]|uniref:RICIN domain-containing protein n=1 Tax=Streptomyces sp. NPDC001276 TaxID=3364555 RepID=UPI003689A9AC
MKFTERGDKNSTLRRPLHRAAGSASTLTTAVLSLIMLGATTAHADTTQTFKNQATGRCLHADVTVPSVYAVRCDGDSWQRWNVHVWADGTREIKHVMTGECLDDSNAYGLRKFPCNASKFQSWYIHRWNDGTIEVKNQATGRCLDDSNAYGTRTYPCNATEFQSWS